MSGSEKMAARGAKATHTITPVEVSFHGPKALAISTGSITVRFERDGASYDCVSWARFVSRLEKTNEAWKLLTLGGIYDRDSIIPVIPGSTPSTPINLECPRESYKCLAWVLAQTGYVINENLPGLDRPESVDKFMDDQYSWLNE